MQPTVSPPRIIGNRYHLGTELGSGGMGTVYRAYDRLTGETVALKHVTIAPSKLSFKSRSGKESNLKIALTQEFQLLASLHHPNIIAVLDYGFDETAMPYFTMNLIEGAQDICAASENVSDVKRIKYIIQMLQALAYLHRRGIIHRDLKPGNVLVDQNNTVRVLDFGLAVEEETAKAISGTLTYMAPEILQGKGGNKTADLYAVGVIAYEMLAGQHPFNTDQISALVHDIVFAMPDMSLIPDELDIYPAIENSPKLTEIILKLTTKFPEDRYQNAEDVIRDLNDAIGEKTVIESEAIRESYLQAARFVGRDSELTQLNEALTQALEGNGSSWLIAGESGVGKSRLLDELRTRAVVQGAIVVRGQEVAGSSVPHQLWRDPVKRLLLTAEIDRLTASILKEVVPDIADIVGYEVPDAPPLDGEGSQERFALAIANLLRNQRYPVVLILEDLHWTTDKLEPLQQMNRIVATLPVLLVASYRDDEEIDVAAMLPDMQLMKLERLSNDNIAALIAAMLGNVEDDSTLVNLLQRETEGNVFFLVETLRTLAEEAGGLGDVVSMDLPTRVLAGGVRNIVMRRLSHVPPQFMETLKLAAVIGRQVDFTLLKTMQATVDLNAWLTACANIPIFHNWDGQWRFAHDKLREILLAQLNPQENADLHRHVAQAIERLYPDDEAQAAQLADHWQAAGEPQREAHYAQIAGRYALKKGFFRDAMRFLMRALANLEDSAPAAERWHIIKLLGDAHESLSEYPQAIRRYRQSIDIARKADSTQGVVESLIGLGEVSQKRGDFETARQCFERALRIARRLDHQAYLGDALNGLGTIDAQQGKLEAARHNFEESLALRRAIADQRGIAASLNNLGIVSRLTGDLSHASHYYQESLALRQGIGDQRGIASSLSNLGIVARSEGQFSDARQYYERAMTIFREIGDLRGMATTLNNLGIVTYEQRDHDACAAYYTESLAILRKIGDQRGIAYTLNNLGRLANARHQSDEALAYLQEALQMTRTLGDQRGIANNLNEMGISYRERQEAERAREHIEQALQLYRAVGDRRNIAFALVNLSQTTAVFSEIESYLQEALQEIVVIDDYATGAEITSHFITLRTRQRQWYIAAQLVGFVQRWATVDSGTTKRANAAESRLDLALEKDEMQAAIAQGAQCTLADLQSLLINQ